MHEATDDERITVCAECLRASCFQAAFPCEAWRTATTKQMRREDLRELDLEAPSYWDTPAGAAGLKPKP